MKCDICGREDILDYLVPGICSACNDAITNDELADEMYEDVLDGDY
ncbi:MAG: hypothetical protein WC307_06955 [Candidatus Nanoarchaeia archaeon]|jgi:hypothetical protein